MYGLQRYKQELSDSNQKGELSEHGENYVYKKIFTTKTHEVNIKTFKALEELSYIQIESIKDTNKSYLILERLGFGQFYDAKEAIKAKLSNNKTEEYQKQMQEIKFKLTDKPLNLNEIYIQYKQNKDNKALKRIGLIIETLKNQNVDIITDELGIPRINYKSETSLAKRMKKEIEQKTESKSFKEKYEVSNEQKITHISYKDKNHTKEQQNSKEGQVIEGVEL